MYTDKEIKVIVENCNTTEELLYACRLFAMLIFLKDMKKSLFLTLTTQLRFRELENLKL